MRILSSNNKIILAKSNTDQRGKYLMFFAQFNI